MGIEFEAVDPGLPGDFGDRLREAVRAGGGWAEVERSPGAVFSTRSAVHPARREWPSDVDVFFVRGRLQVVFHSAGRAERDRFVAIIRDCLASAGSTVDLEEV